MAEPQFKKKKQPRYNAVAYYAKSRGNQANQAYQVSPDSQSRRARAEPGQSAKQA